jgi:SpoVK/Ycf46/Vps4 family AAA+-type ATPase
VGGQMFVYRGEQLGKGLNVLFAGPSGTGKTMATEIMAGELGLALYKIDFSAVVSKYIGETEKNLARIFAEAETSNAILFFDEADALFGKRGEVRDSHDRYANIEISYLLQKREEYEEVVILATNLCKNWTTDGQGGGGGRVWGVRRVREA